MNYMKTEKTVIPVCAYEVSVEEKIELDVNLPDYCADIKRVLRCFVQTNINSTETAGDRVSLKGDVLLRLLYIAEDGKVDCCEQSVALSKYTDIKNMPESAVLVCDVRPLYINTRAVSQRRFNISGNLLVEFKIYSLSVSELCVGFDDGNTETKVQKITAVTNSVMGEKLFDLSETLSLDEKHKSVSRILYTDSYLKNSSCKTVSGKILLKGDMECKVFYISDTKDKTLECITHSMPVSQIIDIPGVEKDFALDMNVSTKSISVTPKTDSTGENRLLDFSLKAEAFVQCTKSGEVCFVKDAFNKKYESKFVFDEENFMCLSDEVDKKKSVNSLLDLSTLAPKEVCDVRIISREITAETKEKEVLLKINHLFSLIFKDEKGKIQYAERNAETLFSLDAGEHGAKFYCMPDVSADNLSASVEGEKVSVKYEVSLKGNLYCMSQIRILKEAVCEETEKSCCNEGTITLYFCNEGENLWDIAKRYNKSEKDIKEENNLDTDTVKADMMLII